MDEVERDNERHRREELERRAKRQKVRESKAKGSHQLSEKERKRREHAQRILGQQQQAQHGAGAGAGGKKRPPPPGSSGATAIGGTSVFQSLFSERAEGFFIDLRFRNAPPRPPVGPTFVGLGLEGELTNKWTKYKARNAVENSYTWKLHPERDLGVPLAVSAMDFEGCYTDEAKKSEKDGSEKGGAGAGDGAPHVIPDLHPDDDALINWRGSMGDSAAEQLQQKQDRVRAAARLAIAQGHGAMPSKLSSSSNTPSTGTGGGASGAATPGSAISGAVRLKKHHLQSRLLDENLPHFMKKTTYLTNSATSVHKFTSLAHTQVQRAKDVDEKLKETKNRYTESDLIERGFRMVNGFEILQCGDAAAGVSTGESNKKRKHPSKKGVHPVWDLPLLPDVPSWGHTYTHVVIDNPPKSIGGKTAATPKKKGKDENKNKNGALFQPERLQKAVVADVSKQANNARMACTVWVPEPTDSKKTVSESESESGAKQPTTKKSKKGDMYKALQQYDLDVVPLRDPAAPAVHYVFAIDPSRKYVGYHNIGSRVQLSTGRPVVVAGSGKQLAKAGSDTTAEMATDESYILHRDMDEEQTKNVEMKMAEVDVDLAEKYGMVSEEDENVGGGESQETTSSKKAAAQKKAILESDSDSDEADAF